MPTALPPRLVKGDTVAALSTSWGGPSAFPAVYENGVRLLESRFGVIVKEYPTTRMDPLELWAHPEARAADLISAFEDPLVAAIVSAIGGDDSNRLLPLLDDGLGRRHPKVLLGFSDTTALLMHFFRGGL
ncbi:MAG: LD-carboxypeptidase, partial [Thermoplasmata archaeon]|nr:LD-carboxypeptidase [Thermoplasmata archaeon]